MSQRSQKCPRCDSAAFFRLPDGYNSCTECGRRWRAPDAVAASTPVRRAKAAAPRAAKRVASPASAKKSKPSPPSDSVPRELTRKGVEALKNRSSAPNAPPVTVLALDVFRYMVDQQCKRALRIDRDPKYELLKDAYDVLVTDGDTKTMISIHPSLSRDMCTGAVVPWTLITITEWKQWYNELEVKGDPTRVVLVTAFEPLHALDEAAFDAKSLEKRPWSSLCNEHDGQCVRPLFGSRGYYVNLFSDNTVAFPERSLSPPEDEDLSADKIQEAPLLKEVAEQFLAPKKKNRKNKLPTRVYGRVMRKSAVLHFAKASDEQGVFPMNFSFFIADDSGECRVVCWNNVCKNVFSSLDIGDVVAVDNFVPKTAYYDQPVLPLNNAPAPKREYVELALNPSNPTGHVWKMPENEDIHSLFPLLTNNVFPLSHVATLADMTQVDIYGVISFVGRLQVENVPRNTYSQWAQKECYRWLKLQDELGNVIACKVYVNTQWRTFSAELVEGAIMFLKEFRVHSITPTARAKDRLVWVSSTPYSRIFTLLNGEGFQVDDYLGGNTMAYLEHNKPAMAQLLDERESQRLNFGETISVPVMGPLDLYRDAFPRTVAVQLSDLAVLCHGLNLFEYRTVLMHHFIESVTVEPLLQQLSNLVHQEDGTAVVQQVDRALFRVMIRDLNDSHTEELHFAVDTDSPQLNDSDAAALLANLLQQYGIEFDDADTTSMANLSEAIARDRVRFQSLLSFYRKSYTEVERALMFISMERD